MSTQKYIITLTYPHPSSKHAGDDYRVAQIEQSTEFKPGMFLEDHQVDELCQRPSWKVIIRHNKP